MRQKIIVFASGTKDGGGSGFENLVEHSHGGDLKADIVAVVSQHERGGVWKRAKRLGVPFVHFPPPWDAERYRKIVADSGAEWVALSGWIKHVKGLDPVRTFNIHPALLSQCNGRFGGPGMYNHREHALVREALEAGEISESGVSMHFATDEYDRGPVFFEYRVSLRKGMSADDIQHLVNAAEHAWQPRITNMVVNGQIRWDGTDPKTLVVPAGYSYLPKE